jgi:hypothetical protein
VVRGTTHTMLVENVALTKAGPRQHVTLSRQPVLVVSALNADPSGRYLILFYDSTAHWIDDGTLRMLPMLGDALAIAW